MVKKFSSLIVFIFFWLLTFALYFKVSATSLATGEIGWLRNFDMYGWDGIFKDKSLHFVYNIAGYFLWRCLGLNGLGWLCVGATLHASIAFAAYYIFGSLFEDEEVNNGFFISFGGALLFLVSPYHTEVLILHNNINYLLGSLFMLCMFYQLLRYLKNSNILNVLLFYLFFFLAVLTLDVSYCVPTLLLAFFLFWPPHSLKGKSRGRLITVFVVPTLLVVVAYFLLSTLMPAIITSDYSYFRHFDYNPSITLANLGKYSTKLFFLTQFLSYDRRNELYISFKEADYGLILFCLVLLGAVGLAYYNKVKPKIKIAVLLFAFFAIALSPILHLFFSFIVNIEGDRLTYFASIFAAQFFVYLCILVLRSYGWILAGTSLIFNLVFFQINENSWWESGIIHHALVNNFKWHNADRIYVLNVPDNYKGVYMFRTFGMPCNFAQCINLETGKNVEKKMVDVVEYNMNDFTDSVIVEQMDSNSLKVTLAQWGNWWWRNGIGAKDFSTDDFKVSVDGWGHAYVIRFKNKIPNTAYIYQCGGKWKAVEGF